MYYLYIMQSTQTLARTQIYLTQTQQTRLAADAADKAQRLSGILGMWAKRDDVADPAAYVRALRAPRF